MHRKTQMGLFALIVAFVLSGCTTELYHGLEERSANEMIVVLQDHGIESEKVVDPQDDERWAVAVPRGAQTEAWKVLEVWGLPRPEAQGFGAFYPRQGLVPTSSEERILLQFATAQELRQTLLAIDSVVDAHVNLVLPEKPRVRLSRDELVPPRASVLVKFRPRDDGDAGVTSEQIKALVAGGVEGMDPKRVEVLMTAVDMGTGTLGDVKVTTVGPVTVAASSKTALQAFVGFLVFLVLALSAGLVFMVIRRGRPA